MENVDHKEINLALQITWMPAYDCVTKHIVGIGRWVIQYRCLLALRIFLSIKCLYVFPFRFHCCSCIAMMPFEGCTRSLLFLEFLSNLSVLFSVISPNLSAVFHKCLNVLYCLNWTIFLLTRNFSRVCSPFVHFP